MKYIGIKFITKTYEMRTLIFRIAVKNVHSQFLLTYLYKAIYLIHGRDYKLTVSKYMQLAVKPHQPICTIG